MLVKFFNSTAFPNVIVDASLKNPVTPPAQAFALTP